MSIKESALTAITAISNSDFVRAVTSAGASRRITVANLAKQIVEGYAGSSLAGSSQSVKSAIDSLNSNWHKVITTGQDLNDLTDIGVYDCANSSITQSLSNCPVTTSFCMIVLKKGAYQTQLIFPGGTMFSRTRNSSGWASWYKFTGTEV